MTLFARLTPAGACTAAVIALVCATAAQAGSLLPHRVGYALSLDASRSSQQLESANGRLDYEIKGNACEGYSVNMRQSNVLEPGEGAAVRSDMASTTWEDGKGEAYRFKTVNRVGSEVKSDVDGIVNRTATGATVQLTKPKAETVELKGDILMPTEHVEKVIAAAQAGESLYEARVFDGSEDGQRVFSTLAVIGRPAKDAKGLPQAADAALAGVTYYPVTISYFDEDSANSTPEYTMTITLYDNGVIGRVSIDYGNFVLRGVMSSFEALPAAAPCTK